MNVLAIFRKVLEKSLIFLILITFFTSYILYDIMMNRL